MSTLKNLIAGLGGAIALNLLHESLKHKKGTPRIDKVGEEALQKTLEPLGAGIENDTNRYVATLAADVVSNALYYAAIGVGSPDGKWNRAVSLGLTAGIGAVNFPEPMGLDDAPVASSTRKQVLTVGYYLFGALATAGLLTILESRNDS